MLNVLAGIWYGFLAVLFPPRRGAAPAVMTTGLRWTLHVLLLALVVVGLYFLNPIFFRRLVTLPLMQPYWLPAFFLLLYFLAWVGWWIWCLLLAEAETSHFPDIDAAWEEGLRALAQAGIPLAEYPLFLVLGRPQAPEEHLFHSEQMQWVVKQTPPGPLAPLHVYANREAIYLTCPGASLLGKHAANLALEGLDETLEPNIPFQDEDWSKTLPLEGTLKRKELLRRMLTPKTILERRANRRDLRLGIPELLKKPGEMERCTARLAHLCRLIVRDRQPFCPINGILVLVPLGGSDTDGEAQQAADICQRDLATVQRIFQVFCPLLVLVCDMEDVPGFRDFVRRYNPNDRQRRLGQRFPLACSDVAGEALREKSADTALWLCNNMLRDWVYKLYRLETPGREDPSAVTAGNSRLFLLLNEMRERGRQLARILAQGIVRDGNGPGAFGGIYLAGTGPEKENSLAFVAGVLRRLVQEQNFVSWSPEALARDTRCNRLVNLAYLLLGGLAATGLAILGFSWWNKGH